MTSIRPIMMTVRKSYFSDKIFTLVEYIAIFLFRCEGVSQATHRQREDCDMLSDKYYQFEESSITLYAGESARAIHLYRKQ